MAYFDNEFNMLTPSPYLTADDLMEYLTELKRRLGTGKVPVLMEDNNPDYPLRFTPVKAVTMIELTQWSTGEVQKVVMIQADTRSFEGRRQSITKPGFKPDA